MVECDLINNEFSNRYKLALDLFKKKKFYEADQIIYSIAKEISPAKLGKGNLNKRKNIKVSIIIVTYEIEYRSRLNKLIESFDWLLETNGYEFIIINNNPNGKPLKLKTFSSKQSIINVGFNYGCSGGRNLGANLASGKYILFLDDDGDTTPESIINLTDCIESNNAIACRGRIIAKDESSISGGHYFKGKHVIPSIIDTEGFSIWEKETFIKHGGFNPLLAGHEGLELCYSLKTTDENYLFLYTPKAILFHNFSDNKKRHQEKLKTHQRNEKYLEYKEINVNAFRRRYTGNNTGFLNGLGKLLSKTFHEKKNCFFKS